MKKYPAIAVFSVFLVYLFWTDFDLFKKIINYNVPLVDDPQISDPDISDEDDDLGFLNLPEGFKITIIAENLDGPRVMAFDPRGRLLVSETKAGKVIVLEDKDGDGSFEDKRILVENLRSPHGLDFYTVGNPVYLYIAETHQVTRYSYDVNT